MADEAKPEARTGDRETDEILAEMEADGIELPAFKDGKTVETTEETDPEENSDPDLEESAEETDEEEEEDEDESDDADEEDDSPAEDDEPEARAKGKKTIVKKYRELRKVNRELRQTIETMRSASSKEDAKTAFDEFVKEANMAPEVAEKLIAVIEKRLFPKGVRDTIAAAQTEQADRALWSDQATKFDKDFNANVVPALEAQGLDQTKIREVYDALNDENSPSYAWSPANAKKSLVALSIGLVKPGAKTTATRRSSEGASPVRNRGSRSVTEKDPSDLTGDDVNEMSDEEFDRFSDDLGKRAKSTIHRSHS